MAGYTLEERQAAGRADLFLFIQCRFPNDVLREGQSIRLKADHSVSIKRGYSGYFDFSKGEGGSGIDLLTTYFGFSLVDAVHALAGFNGYDDLIDNHEINRTKQNQLVIPDRSPTTWRIKKYLTDERKIDSKIVEWLIRKDLLFEDSEYHNCCFMNHNKDFCEFRGTYGRFHKIQKKKSDNYWYFGDKALGKVYVTESAIDAISLYDLRREKACYCSIGGVANYSTIERLVKEFNEVVLAVDADDAGERCRQKFGDLPSIIPEGAKDWNEMLQIKRKGKGEQNGFKIDAEL